MILGIDSGLRRTGWAILQKNGSKLLYVKSGVIKTTKNDNGPSNAVALGEIFHGMSEIILQCKPTSAAIENTYVNENPLSSLKLAQARAAAIVACAHHNLIPIEYQASTIKKAVAGKGNADKAQVYRMITLQLGSIQYDTNDETDAIAIAMCHALHR